MRYSTLVSDLEKALTTRSAESGAMLNQITELFLLHVGHHSDEQLDLYDEVLNELVAKVEVGARIKLSSSSAPPPALDRLAEPAPRGHHRER